jgi:hypothetical protein
MTLIWVVVDQLSNLTVTQRNLEFVEKDCGVPRPGRPSLHSQRYTRSRTEGIRLRPGQVDQPAAQTCRNYFTRKSKYDTRLPGSETE